jgi:hypothetical protein
MRRDSGAALQENACAEGLQFGRYFRDYGDASFIRNGLLQDTDNDGHERYLPKH